MLVCLFLYFNDAECKGSPDRRPKQRQWSVLRSWVSAMVTFDVAGWYLEAISFVTAYKPVSEPTSSLPTWRSRQEAGGPCPFSF